MSNQYMDILKNHGVVMQENSIYPIYKVSNISGAIVRFTDKYIGTCIKSSKIGLIEQGMHSIGWIAHDRTDRWRDLTEEEYNAYVKGKQNERQ